LFLQYGIGALGLVISYTISCFIMLIITATYLQQKLYYKKDNTVFVP
jgi:hypothetical protein